MTSRHSSSRAQPAQPRLHWEEWAAEAAGTAILLFGGLSAIRLDFGPGSPLRAVLPGVSPWLLLTGLLFAGIGSLVALSPLGRLSGAHLNPARSLWPDLLAARIDVLWVYAVGPLAGATVAVLVSRTVMRRGPVTAKMFP